MLALFVACSLFVFDGKDKSAWTQGASGPGTRFAQTLLWDTSSKRAVLFGGGRNTSDGKPEAILGDVWSYDPASDAWSEVKVAGPSPDGRAHQAAAIDAVGRKLYVHGGLDYTFNFRDDLWAFDLDAHTWTAITPVGEGPSNRGGHALLFDEKKQALYLVGGLTAFETFEGSKETWTFDLATSKWKRGPEAPAAVFWHSAMFDPKTRNVLMCGGFNAPNPSIQAWNVDKNAWSKLGSGPPAGIAVGSTFDPVARKWYFACGSDGMGASGALCVYDLEKKKVEKLVKEKRIARAYAPACVDPESGQLLICGGTTGSFGGPCVDDGMWKLGTRK